MSDIVKLIFVGILQQRQIKTQSILKSHDRINKSFQVEIVLCSLIFYSYSPASFFRQKKEMDDVFSLQRTVTTAKLLQFQTTFVFPQFCCTSGSIVILDLARYVFLSMGGLRSSSRFTHREYR